MPVILPVKGIHPQIPEGCFIAPNATIVGDVVMGDDCSIWFNAVVRGDVMFMLFKKIVFKSLYPQIDSGRLESAL